MQELQEIVGLEYLNTSNVTDMSGMFYCCTRLETIDLSHFDTCNVTDNPDLAQRKRDARICGRNHFRKMDDAMKELVDKQWMKKLSGKEAEPLAAAAVELLLGVKPLLHTMTLDKGKEFAKHALIAHNLGIDIYFAHPYHSWERGANENTNGLIRQYFPKGTNFDEITEEQVAKVQTILNNRPRKRLDYKTPLEAFQEMYPDFGKNVAFST